MSSIVCDERRCIACGACVIACLDEKTADPLAPAVPLRRCETVETGTGPNAHIRYTSVSCLHCHDAVCIEACPTGALYRDEETGFVLSAPSVCVGCGACADQCPVSAIAFAPDGTLRKCDGCINRIRQGLLPACVKICPMDALLLIENH